MLYPLRFKKLNQTHHLYAYIIIHAFRLGTTAGGPCLLCQSRSFGLPISEATDHLNRSVLTAMELNCLVLTTILDKSDSTIPARSINQLSVFNNLNSKNKKHHFKKLESKLVNQVLFMIFMFILCDFIYKLCIYNHYAPKKEFSIVIINYIN